MRAKADWGSFTGGRGYGKGEGSPRLLGFGIHWQHFLSQDQAPDIPQKDQNKETFSTTEEEDQL